MDAGRIFHRAFHHPDHRHQRQHHHQFFQERYKVRPIRFLWTYSPFCRVKDIPMDIFPGLLPGKIPPMDFPRPFLPVSMLVSKQKQRTRSNPRHLCAPLGGTEGLIETVGFKKTTECVWWRTSANASVGHFPCSQFVSLSNGNRPIGMGMGGNRNLEPIPAHLYLQFLRVNRGNCWEEHASSRFARAEQLCFEIKVTSQTTMNRAMNQWPGSECPVTETQQAVNCLAYKSRVEVIQGRWYVWVFSRRSIEVDETRPKRRQKTYI